jgi:dienelactone hydrolase
MLQAFFHAWERRLSDVTKDRVVRPFEWGLDWLPAATASSAAPPLGQSDTSLDARGAVQSWVSRVMTDTDAFFTPPPTSRYTIESLDDGERMLSFPSALETPHVANNTVYCRVITPKKPVKGPRAAVLVLPQWNSDATGHLGLARLLAMNGMTALRLSLPYHDRRMPPELARADYIVSSNVVRTVQACRQAVLDARRAIGWLANEGYDRIGILGSSLGSCLALLTAAHEPLIRAEALNHISPHFADVVWRGISTRHVRAGFDGRIELDVLRELWKPISPRWYLERLREKKTLLVYAQYDLTFPRDLSEDLVEAFRELKVPHELAVLPCGHYTTGKAPFKFVDGWILTRFLKRALEAQ